MWKSDGTLEGTGLVKDINPGGPFDKSRPREFTELDGAVYFTADDGVHGDELWRSDGTRDGTVMVKDINPGVGSRSGLTGLIRDCPDQTDSSNHVTLWDGSNYKRAA